MQDFFANQFGGQVPLGLVGDIIFGEVGRPLGQARQNGLAQILESVALHRGNRNVIGEFVNLLVLRDQRQQAGLLFHQIDFVEHQHHGRPAFAHQVHRAPVLFAHRLRGVHHQQQQVAFLQGGANRVHHALVERGIGLVDPGCIDEHDLRFGPRDHALYGGAGGLRFVRHDGHLLPHQGVQQRRLSRVGPPHQRNETGPEPTIHAPPLEICRCEPGPRADRRWPALPRGCLCDPPPPRPWARVPATR